MHTRAYLTIEPRAGKPFYYHSVIIVHRRRHQKHPFHPYPQTTHGPTPSRSDRVIAVSFATAAAATTPKSYPVAACNKNNDLGAGGSSGSGVREGRTHERSRRVGEPEDVSFCGKFQLYSAVSYSISQNDYRVFN